MAAVFVAAVFVAAVSAVGVGVGVGAWKSALREVTRVAVKRLGGAMGALEEVERRGATKRRNTGRTGSLVGSTSSAGDTRTGGSGSGSGSGSESVRYGAGRATYGSGSATGGGSG
ncbi:MAG: hypothetical protein ACRDYC_14280, partial [Acidimicrobiales bacterium]